MRPVYRLNLTRSKRIPIFIVVLRSRVLVVAAVRVGMQSSPVDVEMQGMSGHGLWWRSIKSRVMEYNIHSRLHDNLRISCNRLFIQHPLETSHVQLTVESWLHSTDRTFMWGKVTLSASLISHLNSKQRTTRCLKHQVWDGGRRRGAVCPHSTAVSPTGSEGGAPARQTPLTLDITCLSLRYENKVSSIPVIPTFRSHHFSLSKCFLSSILPSTTTRPSIPLLSIVVQCGVWADVGYMPGEVC